MRRFKVCGGGNGQLFYAHERPAEQGSGGLGAGGLITLTTSITSWNRIADANVWLARSCRMTRYRGKWLRLCLNALRS